MFQPKKSKTLLFILVVIWFSFNWFFVFAPYSQVDTLFKSAPKYVNENLLNRFPSNLIITLKSGQVSINQPSPYCLTFGNEENNGILFDTNTLDAPNARDLEKDGQYSKLCTPIAIVGKEYVIYPDKNSSYKTTKISSDLNYTVDKPSLNNFASQVLPSLLAAGRYVYFIGPLLVGLVAYLFFLLMNTWYTMIVKFFTKVLKIHSSILPDELFNISLFYYTIILAIDWVVFGYLVQTVAGVTTINTNFFMRNTILITLLSLYYQTLHPAITQPEPTTPELTPRK